MPGCSAAGCKIHSVKIYDASARRESISNQRASHKLRRGRLFGFVKGYEVVDAEPQKEMGNCHY